MQVSELIEELRKCVAGAKVYLMFDNTESGDIHRVENESGDGYVTLVCSENVKSPDGVEMAEVEEEDD